MLRKKSAPIVPDYIHVLQNAEWEALQMYFF